MTTGKPLCETEKRCLEATKCTRSTTEAKQERAAQHRASAACPRQCEPRRAGPQSGLDFRGREQHEVHQVLDKHAEWICEWNSISSFFSTPPLAYHTVTVTSSPCFLPSAPLATLCIYVKSIIIPYLHYGILKYYSPIMKNKSTREHFLFKYPPNDSAFSNKT